MSAPPDRRQALREQLAALSTAELAKRLYLCGLVQRIDNELLAMKILFASGDDEPLQFSPPVDAKVTSLAHMMQVELKQRAATETAHEKGEHDHANNTGTH